MLPPGMVKELEAKHGPVRSVADSIGKGAPVMERWFISQFISVVWDIYIYIYIIYINSSEIGVTSFKRCFKAETITAWRFYGNGIVIADGIAVFSPMRLFCSSLDASFVFFLCPNSDPYPNMRISWESQWEFQDPKMEVPTIYKA